MSEIAKIGKVCIDYEKEVVVDSSGKQIEFRPQTFSVFSYLCKNRGRVVTKNELLENVWESVVVTDDSIVKCISEIRKELDIESSIDVKTVTRRGYLLTESQVIEDPSSSNIAEIPTLAVLPFVSLTDNGASFAAGLTEDITTHLSGQKDLFVLARHSASVFGNSDDLGSSKEICDALNVRYLLQGTVQKYSDDIRVNVQLSDAHSDKQVWSERYAESNNNLFEIQDELSAKIVNRISGTAGVLISIERSQLSRNMPSNPEAYDLYIMASNINKSLSKDGALESIQLYKKATDLDPLFSRAWMRLASMHLFCAACAYTDDLTSTIEHYIKSAMTAVELDPNDSLCQAQAGGAFCFMGELIKARECFDRAILLGPNNADTLALVSYIRPTKFQTVSKDLENVRHAKSLNPYFPVWYSLAHGYCAYHAGEYLEAVESLEQADSDIFDTQLYLALSYAELDHVEKVDEHRQIILTMNPDLKVSMIVEGDAMLNEDIIKHFLKSAEKAKLPI